MQSVLASSAKESPGDDGPATPNIGGLLYYSSPPVSDGQSLNLSKWQAIQLWQAYVKNVDPLTKMLHIPTVQITMFTAINNPSEASDDINALLFAIYFAATTSLPVDDAINLLGQDKSSALNAFKKRLEESLARANLLENPSLVLLRALAIYLVGTILSKFTTSFSSVFHFGLGASFTGAHEP